jgi:hypothetical protein
MTLDGDLLSSILLAIQKVAQEFSLDKTGSESKDCGLTPAPADSGSAAPRRRDLPECAIIGKVSRQSRRCR